MHYVFVFPLNYSIFLRRIIECKSMNYTKLWKIWCKRFELTTTISLHKFLSLTKLLFNNLMTVYKSLAASLFLCETKIHMYLVQTWSTLRYYRWPIEETRTSYNRFISTCLRGNSYTKCDSAKGTLLILPMEHATQASNKYGWWYCSIYT